jgi:hypothetical protein
MVSLQRTIGILRSPRKESVVIRCEMGVALAIALAAHPALRLLALAR